MKVGYFAVGIGPGTDPEWVRTIATNVERLGFSTIWAAEHVVLLDQYASKYPYSAGEFPMPTETPFGDPFTTLAYVAAVTSRIRLATGICLVPEHNPLVLAKTVATLDRLSGGRFILGIGIGWLEEEFRAIGVPWERRAQRTREYIEAMRKLWTRGPTVRISGEFVKFREARSFPSPPTAGACRYGSAARAARPCGASLNTATAGSVSILRQRDRHQGQAHRGVAEGQRAQTLRGLSRGLSLQPSNQTDDLKRYRDAGAEEVALVLTDIPATEREMIKGLERMARDFVEAAARL